ncbi:MAG: hypothetical protein Q7S48_02855, partial [bacterium]|nr:hypothetical protein [bacterium]
MYNRSTQRAIIGILLTCFCFVFVVASFWVPQPVLATAHPIVIAEDIPARVEKAEASFGNQILASAIIGLLNTITLVGQQLAYDLAVGLSSGCRGENACAFTKDPGTYFTAVAYDAAGEFIGNLAESWEFLGFSLCNPRIPDVGLAIALGLAEKFQRPKPKCDFVNTINNWQNTVREVRDPHALLKHASLAFEPGNTDLGQAFQASEEFRIHIKKKEEAELTKRLEGGGILPQSGIISGNITTPAVVIKSEYEDLPRSG